MLCAVSLGVGAQEEVCNLTYDGNNNGVVGLADLLGLLTEYGVECENEPESSFTCGDSFGYQGYDYETAIIGEDCWFAENLRSWAYANGDGIPTGLSDLEWENTDLGAVAEYGGGCVTSSSSTWCNLWLELGLLYNWYAVEDERGLCPSGWHVSTDTDWITLEIALGMSEEEANSTGFRGTDQGTQIKSTNSYPNVVTWYEGGGGMDGTNTSGFNALPAGRRNGSGGFGGFAEITTRARYWTSSSSDDDGAWVRTLSHDTETVRRYSFHKDYGQSVRCIKDSE